MIQGGMGVAAGGNINPDEGGTSMFEPMGGSAPKYTGKNVINPIAAIGAMSMLLEQTGQSAAGQRILNAIQLVTGTQMKSQAAGQMGCGTAEVGGLVVGGGGVGGECGGAAVAGVDYCGHREAGEYRELLGRVSGTCWRPGRPYGLRYGCSLVWPVFASPTCVLNQSPVILIANRA